MIDASYMTTTSATINDPSLTVDLKTDWGSVCLTATVSLIIALVRVVLARRDRRTTPRRSASARKKSSAK